MNAAREEVLERIRRALADRPQPAPVRRNYHTAGWASPDQGRFADRVSHYRATVHRLSGEDAIAATVGELVSGDLAVPPGLPRTWCPPGVVLRVDEPPLSLEQLESAGGVLTACAVAIAETGTIVLDHRPDQGRRALTLLPDHHVVVVRQCQVVAGVPDAVAVLDPNQPLTWISGPSATSDIELIRVEGVHGPRRLDVLLIGD